MSASSTAPDPKEERKVHRIARTGATLAHRLATGVAGLASLSAVAGGLLWGLLWWPPAMETASVLGAALTLGVLLAPAVVLALFWVGLHDLLALPDRLAERTERTVEQSAAAAESVITSEASGVLGRLGHVVRQIWALRSVLLENRALLLHYGALIRFLHPGFLLLVAGAAVGTLLLLPLSAGAGLLAWLW